MNYITQKGITAVMQYLSRQECASALGFCIPSSFCHPSSFPLATLRHSLKLRRNTSEQTYNEQITYLFYTLSYMLQCLFQFFFHRGLLRFMGRLNNSNNCNTDKQNALTTERPSK